MNDFPGPQRSIAPTVPPYRRVDMSSGLRAGAETVPRGCDPAPVAPSHPPPATNSQNRNECHQAKALTPPPSPLPRRRSGDVAGVKTIILGGDRGTALAAEIKSSGDPALASLVKPGDRCDPCLLPVDGVPAIEYWLGCVDGVAKCGKGPASVFVTHAADAKADFERLPDLAPSGGRCTAVSNGADSAMPTPGPAGDLLCALEDAVGYDSHVLLIDASFLSTPDYDLNGFVQHAMGRGKDCVAYLDVDQSEAGVRAQLALERNPAGRVVANPEVVSVVPYPDGLKGEGGSKPSGTRTVAVCGPVWFLRASTLPLVAEFFADEGLRWSQSGVAPDEMLGRMLAFLQARETFYALEMKHCFPIAAGVGAYRYVDSLFGFLAGERRRATGRYKSGWASGGGGDASERKKILLERFAIQDRRAGDARERAVSAETDADVLVPRFNAAYGRPVLPEDPYAQRGDELPARFKDAGAWSKSTPSQHPVYVTSNNQYGIKTVGPGNLPIRWHGVKGEFTDGFGGAMYRDNGLDVRVQRSKVHSAHDGII